MEDNKSLRHNEGKVKWSLINFVSLRPLVDVLNFGAKKYSPNNWKKGFDKKELEDSLLRHVTALIDGEEYDTESKLHHIGHIMCNCMFYSYHFVKLQGTEITPKDWEQSPITEEDLTKSLLPLYINISKQSNEIMSIRHVGMTQEQSGLNITATELKRIKDNLHLYELNGQQTDYIAYYKLKL